MQVDFPDRSSYPSGRLNFSNSLVSIAGIQMGGSFDVRLTIRDMSTPDLCPQPSTSSAGSSMYIPIYVNETHSFSRLALL